MGNPIKDYTEPWKEITIPSQPKAQKCPVCQGKGKVTEPLIPGSGRLVECHGCDGKGWVTVR